MLGVNGSIRPQHAVMPSYQSLSNLESHRGSVDISAMPHSCLYGELRPELFAWGNAASELSSPIPNVFQVWNHAG
jgi:hypothetical protein